MQASAAKAVQASQMHTRSRTVTELIQEAHTESSTLQGQLETSQRAHSEDSERLKSARSSHENLDELLAVAENARLVSAAVARAHEATQKSSVASQKAEDSAACKREEFSRLLAKNRLLEGSGTTPDCTESGAGLFLVLQKTVCMHICQRDKRCVLCNDHAESLKGSSTPH